MPRPKEVAQQLRVRASTSRHPRLVRWIGAQSSRNLGQALADFCERQLELQEGGAAPVGGSTALLSQVLEELVKINVELVSQRPMLAGLAPARSHDDVPAEISGDDAGPVAMRAPGSVVKGLKRSLFRDRGAA